MTDDHETATGNVTEKEIKKFSKRIPMVMTIDEDIAAARFQYRDQDDETIKSIILAASNDHEEARRELRKAQDKENEAKMLLERKYVLIKKPNSTPLPMDDKVAAFTVKQLRLKREQRRTKRWAAKELMEKTAKELDNLNSKDSITIRKEGEVWKDGTLHKMEWSYAPKYVESVMPDKENPETVYVAIKHQLMNNTFTLTADQAIKSLDRFFHSIPDNWPVFKRYIYQISKEMTDQKMKSHFDRRQGLNLLSMVLKKSHQILFDVYLHRNKNNAGLHEPFDASTLKKMEQFRTSLKGDAALLPIGHQTVAKRAILNAFTDGKLNPKTKIYDKKDKKVEKVKKFQLEGGPTKDKKRKKSKKEKDKKPAGRKEGARNGELPELSTSKRQKLIDKMDAQGFQALLRAAKGNLSSLKIQIICIFRNNLNNQVSQDYHTKAGQHKTEKHCKCL